MSIESLTEMAQWRGDHGPEGIEVVVVTDDPDIARRVAPMLARTLFPDRRFGPILHVGDETLPVQGIPVVVRDLGPVMIGGSK